ncbi:hypothetical protein [Janibacter indicus]|uniref:hypothetical protein n=1 Tax=Janibacter indicus TaxID=857417 RepID=UPI003D9A4229
MSSARVSWLHAVVAVPVAAIAWVVVAGALAYTGNDIAFSGLVACGVGAAIGAALLLVPRPDARGLGLGTIATMLPCAIGLAISLM